jgi:hypothetical protein
MQLRTSSFSQQVKMLEQERSWIQRQFLELDEAILQGQGSPRILEAARTLVPYLLLHFTHQEQFRKMIPPALVDERRTAWKKQMEELLQIDAALTDGEVYAALRLRSFCRAWMHPHLPLDEIELQLTHWPSGSQTEAAHA